MVETALKEAIRQGYRSHVALVHVIFQGLRLFGNGRGLWRDPKWVGQITRSYGWAAPEKPVRPRLWDKQFRVMRLEPAFVERVVRDFRQKGIPLEPPKQPLAFCLDTPCEECAYLNWCDLRPDKEKWLKRHGKAGAAKKRRELEEAFLLSPPPPKA